MLVVKVLGSELSEYVNVYSDTHSNHIFGSVKYVEILDNFEYSKNLKSILSDGDFDYSFLLKDKPKNSQYKRNIKDSWVQECIFLFEFDDEDEALYFKLKFCS